MPVFAPVTLPADPSALVDGGLVPAKLEHDQRRRRRLQPAHPPLAGAPIPWASSIWSKSAHGQYRVGTPNFFALTHYNRSYFYATAVADLAAEIEAASTAERDRQTAPQPATVSIQAARSRLCRSVAAPSRGAEGASG